MIPIHQTIFGDGSNGGERGNCFAACLASILELPLAEVPNVCNHDDWRDRTNLFLAALGLFYLDVALPGDGRDEHVRHWGYHVMSGPGPRSLRHSVVGRAGAMVHDPHPSGAGLVVADEYGLLIPLDPSDFYYLDRRRRA